MMHLSIIDAIKRETAYRCEPPQEPELQYLILTTRMHQIFGMQQFIECLPALKYQHLKKAVDEHFEALASQRAELSF
ncbi:hypothetical protein [Pleionea sp. CnH1-48]|uniref:hypothetical protein n=1 Tax=Pleionea sp. CnH1-48 TaxID=2954494 RepID=UPI002097C46F|nr:hypothetical protein [Pleionea sp. CnH1-48]MCO7223030.1 hypothetical protein [Pleionea sp. CnH1-48]